MAGDKAGAILHGEGFIRARSKRFGVHRILLLLYVEIQREARYGKAGGHVEIHPYFRTLHRIHEILGVYGEREWTAESQVDGSCKTTFVFEHDWLLPYFTGLKALRIHVCDGHFAPAAIDSGAGNIAAKGDVGIRCHYVASAGCVTDRCRDAVVVGGIEVVVGIIVFAALHVHLERGPEGDQDIRLAYIQTAVVVCDVGELLSHGGTLEVIEGDAVDRMMHAVASLSVNTRDAEGVTEVAKDVVINVIPGFRVFVDKVRLIIVCMPVTTFVKLCLQDYERVGIWTV